MTHDARVLMDWIKVVTIVAAVCTTSVPVIYSFSPWYRSMLGRLFMMKALSFALAMDLSVVFMFWKPSNILILFWIDAIVLTIIAGSTAALAVLIWKMNHPKEKRDSREAE